MPRSRPTHVLDVGERPERLCRKVYAPERLAHRTAPASIRQRDVRIDPQTELSSAHEIAVRQRPRSVAVSRHDVAIPRDQVGNRHLQALRGDRHQFGPRRRRGLPHRNRAALDRCAARGHPLVGSSSGDPLDHPQVFEGDSELVGDELQQRRIGPCSLLDLARVNGDHAGAIDGEPRVDGAGVRARQQIEGTPGRGRRGGTRRADCQGHPGFWRCASGGTPDRPHDAEVGAATAQIALQSGPDLVHLSDADS